MIPDWNSEGLLPPYSINNTGSPYQASPIDLVRRFGLTPHRQNLLEGFLEYRKLLYRCGIDSGVQWVNGSFVEDKERLTNSNPSDIDVVTFFQKQMSKRQTALAYTALCPDFIKQSFGIHVDQFNLYSLPTEAIVEIAGYWNSVWSHQKRTFARKGYVHVPLSEQLDKAAFKLLHQLNGSS